ncbi:MAG: energy-coupled thiamine transporter ThiT, partial [Pygmaiobacter sp.]
MTQSYSKTRTLVECALMIAIGTVLAQIKIFEMPNGGSITLLSMLPFVLVSFRHGVKWGIFTGFVNSLLQMLLGFYAPPAGTLGAL